MILFFDTETTGFLQPGAPLNHPSQPHIVQLAAQLCDDTGTILAGFSLIVDPGVPLPERVSAIHGITDERAALYGVKPATALGMFAHLYGRAELLVAHNIKFDMGVMDVAYTRHRPKDELLQKPRFCTMEAATPIINMPPTDRMRAAGFTKPKPPKLEEAIRHFFDEPLDGAHDAMVDVIACRRVFFHLRGLGVEVAA